MTRPIPTFVLGGRFGCVPNEEKQNAKGLELKGNYWAGDR